MQGVSYSSMANLNIKVITEYSAQKIRQDNGATKIRNQSFPTSTSLPFASSGPEHIEGARRRPHSAVQLPTSAFCPPPSVICPLTSVI
jgi:hypothetical protein